MAAKKKPGFGRTIVLTTLGLVIAGGAIFSYFSPSDFVEDVRPSKKAEWLHYASKDQSFQIQFPKAPTERTSIVPVGSKRLNMYQMSLEDDQTEYMVAALDFPKIWKFLGTNKLLKTSFNKMVETEKDVEQIIHNELTDHHGFPALSYRLVQAGNMMHGKIVVVGNTLYRITVTCPKEIADKTPSSQFIESFGMRRS